MTQNLTVLVIGAGANADFRLKKEDEKELIAMPTGEQLVEKIADWEGQIFPNLVYGYILCKARELNFGEIAEVELISNFVLSKNEEWSWQNQILPQSQYPRGGAAFLDRKKLLIDIGLDWDCNKFSKSWVSQRIKESESFSWHHKISEIVKHYQPFSIDEMLDSIKIGKVDVTKWTGKTENDQDEKRKLIQAGKDLIALFLLQSEDKKVFDYDSICWYRHLRNAIITCGKDKKEIKEKLKNFVIISFNYDRSLDYFLRTRVGEFYQDIEIKYPYGSLSEEEIWNEGDYKKIPYGSAKKENSFQKKWDNFQKAKELAKNLSVIGELEENEKGIKRINHIKKVMADSKKLYFLGFAFHQDNCRIMGMLEGKFNKHPSAVKLEFRQGIFYTNFKNSKKLKSGFDAIFNFPVDPMFDVGISSEKGTYDALAQDFDFKV